MASTGCMMHSWKRSISCFSIKGTSSLAPETKSTQIFHIMTFVPMLLIFPCWNDRLQCYGMVVSCKVTWQALFYTWFFVLDEQLKKYCFSHNHKFFSVIKKRILNHLNVDPTKWSNTLKQFVCSWVCLTFLRGWHLKR